MKNFVVAVGVIASLIGLFTFLTGKDLTNLSDASFAGSWQNCEFSVYRVHYMLTIDQVGRDLSGELTQRHIHGDELFSYIVRGQVDGNVGHIEFVGNLDEPAEAIAELTLTDDADLAINYIRGNEQALSWVDKTLCRAPEDAPIPDWMRPV